MWSAFGLSQLSGRTGVLCRACTGGIFSFSTEHISLYHTLPSDSFGFSRISMDVAVRPVPDLRFAANRPLAPRRNRHSVSVLDWHARAKWRRSSGGCSSALLSLMRTATKSMRCGDEVARRSRPLTHSLAALARSPTRHLGEVVPKTSNHVWYCCGPHNFHCSARGGNG